MNSVESTLHPNLHVSTHPLVAHKITLLSNAKTDTILFRKLVAELTQLIIYESTANLPLIEVEYTSPLEQTPVSAAAAL